MRAQARREPSRRPRSTGESSVSPYAESSPRPGGFRWLAGPFDREWSSDETISARYASRNRCELGWRVPRPCQANDCCCRFLGREVVGVDDDVVVSRQLAVNPVKALQIVGTASVTLLDHRLTLLGINLKRLGKPGAPCRRRG